MSWRGTSCVVLAIAGCGVAGVAPAAGAPPATETYEDRGDGTWVLPIDPQTYGGARGSVTFYDEGYRGPGGASVNDFQVGGGYDPSRPSFTQDVVVIEQDWQTRDPATTVWSDDLLGFGRSPTSALRDGNMDGQVNLGSFGWTTPPGTQFAAMQIDRAGNYFVARKDMRWGFFDQYRYKPAGGDARTIDTNFNFQPYPLSDAYGFCGSVLTLQPRALQRQSGQLVFDMAFDVYPGDGSDGSPVKSTQVVPGFVMRSYGSYAVDVTNRFGQRQQFVANTSGINRNPLTGALDESFYQKVSPVGAGVIPDGAWVLHDGDRERMVVVPEGTPGATYHRNEFAGFAYVLRGDVLRQVTDLPGADYETRSTWSDYPLAASLKRASRLRITAARLAGGTLRVAGTTVPSATGAVTVSFFADRVAARSQAVVRVPVEDGRFSATLPATRALARTSATAQPQVTVRYAGDDTHRRALARTLVRRGDR